MIAAAIDGYHRRRGWLAWHVAKLVRVEPGKFPDLDELTGRAVRAAPQTAAQQVSVVRQWKQALRRMNKSGREPSPSTPASAGAGLSG